MRRWFYILAVSFLAFLPAQPFPAKVVYVAQDATGDGSGSSWENACTTITAGLAASASGDEIWVKSATYPEAAILTEGVRLYGGFLGIETDLLDRNTQENLTVIDAAGRNTHAVVGADLAVLDGFNVTGGSAEKGGGVYVENATMSLVNCSLMGNSANVTGSGVYCTAASLTLTKCTLRDNSGGGSAASITNSIATLDECRVTNNIGTVGSGGIGISWSSATLSNCVIESNWSAHGGGAMYCYHSAVTLLNCKITGNSGRFGGGVVCFESFDLISSECESLSGELREKGVDTSGYSPTFVNCVIAGNTASDGRGGAVFCDNTVPVFENCTIAGNTGPGVYSRMYYYDEWDEGVLCGCAGFPKLVNTILWDNKPWQTEWKIIRYEDSETQWPGRGEGWQMTYSCVRGGWPGEGNVESDPQFVDPAAGDYRLQPGSPCIDSGSNEAAQDVSLDLDGRIRVWNGGTGLIVDMGAYEFGSVLPTPTPVPRQLWVLDGFGQVHYLPAPTPTP